MKSLLLTDSKDHRTLHKHKASWLQQMRQLHQMQASPWGDPTDSLRPWFTSSGLIPSDSRKSWDRRRLDREQCKLLLTSQVQGSNVGVANQWSHCHLLLGLRDKAWSCGSGGWQGDINPLTPLVVRELICQRRRGGNLVVPRPNDQLG